MAAEKAGQAEDRNCILCGEREDSDHFWRCKELKEEREEADKELAQLDPEVLHPAIRHGIAPAMSAKLKATYWGGEITGMDKCCMKLLGNVPEGLTPLSIRDEVKTCEAEWTAREVIQN